MLLEIFSNFNDSEAAYYKHFTYEKTCIIREN